MNEITITNQIILTFEPNIIKKKRITNSAPFKIGSIYFYVMSLGLIANALTCFAARCFY